MDIICSERQTGFEEQIMSKDKYSSIFLHQIEAIVFIILQIFFLSKIGEYHLDIHSFCWGIFRHMTHLDQVPVNENI